MVRQTVNTWNISGRFILLWPTTAKDQNRRTGYKTTWGFLATEDLIEETTTRIHESYTILTFIEHDMSA